MAKYIKKKALKNAIDCCTWYHINKNGELVEGANSAEHEPLYKYSDIKRIIKSLPTRKFDEEPQTCKINPKEPTNMPKCFDCEDFFTCDGHCDEVEDEPQTDCSWK